MIWVNVGPQPIALGSQPAPSKGKITASDPVHVHLRRRKIDALHLLLSFVFATKHYLRGEDGFNYPDYLGVLPPSFARLAGLASGHYATSVTASHEGTVSGVTTPDNNKPDATKRVRVKRSKQLVADPTTPLLHDYRSVDINLFSDDASMPLPLMSVPSWLPLMTTCFF